MKNWENIRDEIYQQQESLTEAELAMMKRDLAKGSASGYKYGLTLLLLLLTTGAWWWFTPIEQNALRPTNAAPVAKKIKLPAAAESKPLPTNSSAASETELPPKAKFKTDASIEKTSQPLSESSKTKGESLKSTPNDPFAVEYKLKGLAHFQTFAEDSLVREKLALDFSKSSKTARVGGRSSKRFSAKIFAGYSLALNAPELNLDPETQHYRFKELAQDGGLGGGAHLGAELHYRVYKSFSLGLGFDFFELQRQYNFNHGIEDIPVVDSASGKIVGYLTRAEVEQISESGQSSFGYLGLPFSVDYFYNLSTRWSLRGEARYTHYLNIYARGRELNAQSLRPREVSRESAQNYGSVKLSVALQYRLSPINIVAFESSYTRFTGALYQNTVYNWQPQMLGLQLQLIYEF